MNTRLMRNRFTQTARSSHQQTPRPRFELDLLNEDKKRCFKHSHALFPQHQRLRIRASRGDLDGELERSSVNGSFDK